MTATLNPRLTSQHFGKFSQIRLFKFCHALFSDVHLHYTTARIHVHSYGRVNLGKLLYFEEFLFSLDNEPMARPKVS